MRVDDLDATIQMMLYTDHTYTKAYTSAPSIELRDKVGQLLVTALTGSETRVLLLKVSSQNIHAGICGGDCDGACRILLSAP